MWFRNELSSLAEVSLYIINNEVHFVGYLYIIDLIYARKMEHYNKRSDLVLL